MATHKGTLSITRRQREFNLRDPNYNPDTSFDMELQISGADHTGKVIEVVISGAELMNALANLHARPCTIEVFPERIERLGKRKETQTFDIKDRGNGKQMKMPPRLEIEGWVYSSGYGDYRRAHETDKGRFYNCTFVRWVEKNALADDDFPEEIDLPWEKELPTTPRAAVLPKVDDQGKIIGKNKK